MGLSRQSGSSPPRQTARTASQGRLVIGCPLRALLFGCLRCISCRREPIEEKDAQHQAWRMGEWAQPGEKRPSVDRYPGADDVACSEQSQAKRRVVVAVDLHA
ncbi:hypothetical protein PSEUDO8Z_60033 [Pseudomonas sp. 8Z]|nr:hypothetical protein PSEUDO8Z_60033 [Pseudomonas sp. 8Z]